MAPTKEEAIFTKYISSRRILIADASASARAGLAKAMVSMGAVSTNISIASKIDDARQLIQEKKPDVVFCDFELGNGRGLDLLQMQREESEDARNSLFILVTGNTSQSAVAQAAEEDVDMYLLKPYTLGVLRQSVMRAAIAKINPSDYHKKIEEGKELLFGGRADEAMKVFEEARKLDPRPSLACFYYGQAELIKEAMDEAEQSYKAGLKHNKIHYKCMVGLFELMMRRKMYEEAYEVVKRISRYFPANPKRLTQVLRLAVMTNSYEDIERYYQAFTGIDERNEELIRYVCAALVVCGKYYLRQTAKSRAISLFQKAAVTAGGKTKILREIIMALVEHELAKDAESFLSRFPPEAQSGPDYQAMNYLISDSLAPAGVSIDIGRKLIAGGLHDPLIYKTLIARSREKGLDDAAEQLAHDAAQQWPDRKKEFVGVLPAGESRVK